MSKLISIDGKIFLYKGEQKEYPKKPNLNDYVMPAGKTEAFIEKERKWEVRIATFERDCILVEDQEMVSHLLFNRYAPVNDRVLYSVSVEMEIVEQWRSKGNDEWMNGQGPRFDKNYEYRTIARIKKEESNLDKILKAIKEMPQEKFDKMVAEVESVSPTRIEERDEKGIKEAFKDITPEIGERLSKHFISPVEEKTSQTLETCGGEISMSTCQKCYQRSESSSAYCTRLVPVPPVEEKKGDTVFTNCPTCGARSTVVTAPDGVSKAYWYVSQRPVPPVAKENDAEKLLKAEMDEVQKLEDALWEIAGLVGVTRMNEHTEPSELLPKIKRKLKVFLTPKTPETMNNEQRLRHILEVVDSDLSVMEGKQLRDIQKFIRTELYKVDNEVVTPNEEEQELRNTLIRFCDSLMDYTREGHTILGHDERGPEYFVDEYLSRKK